jgi:hypothetical protein
MQPPAQLVHFDEHEQEVLIERAGRLATSAGKVVKKRRLVYDGAEPPAAPEERTG